jgi:hypothetical protein
VTILGSGPVSKKGLVLLAILLFSAGALRVGYFDDSRFIAERQYRSALLARAAYLSSVEDQSSRRKAIAKVSAARMGRLEPRVMESLSAFGYRVLGGEPLWFPSRPGIAENSIL